VRNAGHVVDPHVVGSIEYGVDLMGANLVVVLGHRSCGAVAAATNTITTGEQTSASVRALVDAVIPSIVEFTAAGPESVAAMDPAQLLRAHVRRTVELVQASSPSIAEAVTDGRCAVVGAHYDLETGAVEVVTVAGDIGEAPTA
jgi:carbonic anhydrase